MVKVGSALEFVGAMLIGVALAVSFYEGGSNAKVCDCDRYDVDFSNPIYVRSPHDSLFVMLPFYPDGEEGIVLNGRMSPWGRCANDGDGPELMHACVVEEKDLTKLGRFVYDHLEWFEWSKK